MFPSLSKTPAFSFASEYVLFTLVENKIPEGRETFLISPYHTLPSHMLSTEWKMNIIFCHYLAGTEGILSCVF